MFRAFVLGWLIAVPLTPSIYTTGTTCVPCPEEFKTAGEGKAYLLTHNYTKMTGKQLQPMSQGGAPSCGGAAMAKALEILHGVPFSAEYCYGKSRTYIPIWQRLGAGTFCGFVVRSAEEHGVLPAANYAALGEDLSVYSAKRAADYGLRGPPESLDGIAALYKSQGYYHIHDWAELRGAIAKGYPVIVGSSVSYGPTTGQVKDRDGTLRRRWWGRWAHAMCIIGVDDREGKQAACILNSWGPDWVSGPKRFNEPNGTFWGKKKDIQKMIDSGDCYAIRPVRGLRTR